MFLCQNTSCSQMVPKGLRISPEASRSLQETFSSTWRTFDDFFQNSFFDMSQPYSESRKIVRILHAKFTCSLSQKKVARNKKRSKTPMFWRYFWLLMSVNIKFSKHLGGRLATLFLNLTLNAPMPSKSQAF